MGVRLLAVVLFATLAVGAGCTYYEVAPGTYAKSPASKFDRAWAAATGAFGDQGISVTRQDREAGVIQGSRQGIVMTATLKTQTDGSVRVEFHSSGATEKDPDLIQRVSRSYDVRMGR